MNNEYLLGFHLREEDINLTTRRNRHTINNRTVIQNLMMQIVHAIHISRSGISHNSPMKIDVEGAITYEVVRYYMASKINVAYVEKDLAEEHLIAIRSNYFFTADMVNINGKLKLMVHQESSQYGGIRSAINHVYILEILQIPEIIKIELSTFVAGM